MDQLSTVIPERKRRRRFTSEFKQQVLSACDVPGQSVASVARQYDLNANLLHKWRRTSEAPSPTGFIRLPAPTVAVVSPPAESVSRSTVHFSLPGGVNVYWPVSEIDRSVHWLKAMIP